MELIILGSGGSIPFPRPFCSCKVCSKARKKGIPYARWGPSLFVVDEFILFDTPEEIRFQIERESIKQINHVFYTHWHPDHTQGMRIFEHMNFSYTGEKVRKTVPKVYVPENCMDDFQKTCHQIFYFEKRGFIETTRIKDREKIEIGDVFITPLDFKRNDRVRYGYLIEQKDKRVVYAPCSNLGMHIDDNYKNLDVLFMETGWFGDTEKARKNLPRDHVWQDHISFEENLNMIKELKPKVAVLTHIDATRHLRGEGDHDFLLEVTKKYTDFNIKVAYDKMRIKL